MNGTTLDGTKAVLTLAGVEVTLRADGYISMKFLKAGCKQYKDLVRDFKNNGRLSRLLEAEAAIVADIPPSHSPMRATQTRSCSYPNI